jgi:hypothetical protein
MINAGSDTVITPFLSQNVTFTYGKPIFPEVPLPTTDLNIQAYFDSDLKVQSSLVTFIDNSTANPKRTRRCEQFFPFSIFVDRNGNYHTMRIPVGTYSVSAVPYTQANCTGRPIPGKTITDTFTVKGCDVSPAVRLSNREYLPMEAIMVSLPCNSFLSYFVRCAYPVRNAKIHLMNAVTNTTVLGDSVYIGKNVSEYDHDYKTVMVHQSGTVHFGKLSNVTAIGVIPITNQIRPSLKYIMTLTLDGFVYPSLEFALQGSCTRG